MWTVRWPIHQGFNRADGDEFFYIVPTNKTEYGDIIPNDLLIEVMKDGILLPDMISHKNGKTLGIILTTLYTPSSRCFNALRFLDEKRYTFTFNSELMTQ